MRERFCPLRGLEMVGVVTKFLFEFQMNGKWWTGGGHVVTSLGRKDCVVIGLGGWRRRIKCH